MNLTQILAQLVALANRREFTANTSLQTTFISQAVMRIQKELRCPAMEKNVEVTIASPYTGLVIPDDFLELIYLMPTNTFDKLTKVDITKARKGSMITADPEVYCRDGAQWILAPSPAIGDTLNVSYYAELSPLVNGTDTNVISLVAWDLIVYAALVQFAIFYKDVRKQDFEDQYQTILQDLQGQSDDDDESSAAVVEPCYQWPLDWEFENY